MKTKTILLCLLLSASAFAQDATGTIKGTVKKGTEMLPGVTVSAVNSKKEKVAEAVTDAEGKFELKDLKPGLYTLKGVAPKEKKLASYESGYINALAGKPIDNNFTLRDWREETIVFPKGFDEKNTNSPMNGLLIVQLQVGNTKSDGVRKDGIGCHYPVGNDQGEAQEGLIKWDLSSIPSNAIIVSAKVGLFCHLHLQGSNRISMQRVLVPWTEKANWETYDGVKRWQKLGGTGRKDIDYAIEAMTDVPAGGDKMNTWLDFEVTNMVQKWVSKEEPNYGMKTKTTGTASISCFNSATYNGTNFIKLTVVIAK